MTWSVTNEFGYYSKQHPFHAHVPGSADYSARVARDAHLVQNFRNGLGYIPLIGVAIGVLRIKDAFAKDVITGKLAFPLANRVVSVIRGGCEILGVGLLFLIPDLLVTIGREIKIRKEGTIGTFDIGGRVGQGKVVK